jgi:co-chaperonin GroES (HSP10)
MRVIGDRILVALPPDVGEVTTASGLVLARDPDIIRTPCQGIVMQLGEKSRQVNLDTVLDYIDQSGNMATIREDIARLAPARFDVAVGECVVFTRYVGEEFQEDGITYVVLRESDIIGIREPNTEAAA